MNKAITRKTPGTANRKRFFLFFAACMAIITVQPGASAQTNTTTLGIEFKPIFPSDLFSTPIPPLVKNNNVYTISPQIGYSAGAVVRIGITHTWTIESGIYYTRRNYNTHLQDSVGNSVSDNFSFVNYEVPFLGLIYIKLAKNIYLNNAFGFCLDFFPTDVQTQDNGHYYERVVSNSWVLPALMANVGAEYRTADKGYFYIGALYHRMLVPMAATGFYSPTIDRVGTIIQGHYFAVDLKYFFSTKRTPVLDNGF
jgi:hypothetical protein